MAKGLSLKPKGTRSTGKSRPKVGGKVSSVNAKIDAIKKAYQQSGRRDRRSGDFDLPDGNYSVQITEDTSLRTSRNGDPSVAWVLKILDGPREGLTFWIWDNFTGQSDEITAIRMDIFFNRLLTILEPLGWDEDEVHSLLDELEYSDEEDRYVCPDLEQLLADLDGTELGVRIYHDKSGRMRVAFDEVVEYPVEVEDKYAINEDQAGEQVEQPEDQDESAEPAEEAAAVAGNNGRKTRKTGRS